MTCEVKRPVAAMPLTSAFGKAMLTVSSCCPMISTRASAAHARRFAALGDPTRLSVFTLIARSPLSVAEVAERLPVSRPAVSQHLKVLKDAGLVIDEAQGASRVYRIDPNGLGPLRRWLDQQWERSLDNFKRLAEQEDQ